MDEEVSLPGIVKRKTTSIYVDPLVWKGFMAKCSKTGQSTCHVLEAFMYAFNKALPDMPLTSLPAVNVHLTVNRIVQRVRRKSTRVIDAVNVVTEGGAGSCAYCELVPVAIVSVREVGDVIREVYACEDHFFEIRDRYTRISWMTLREFSWRPWRR